MYDFEDGARELRAGNREKAHRIFEEIIRAEPANKSVRSTLARIKRQTGDRRAAIQLLEEGLQRDPDHAPFYSLRLQLFYCGNEYEDLKAFYECADRRISGNIDLAIAYSIGLAQMGKEKESCRFLEDKFAESTDTVIRDRIGYHYCQFKTAIGASSLKISCSAPRRCDPIVNACVIAMVKDEEDIIARWLQHNYDLGFRLFFLIDNASTDATAALIEDFARRREEALVVTTHDPLQPYFQDYKTNAMSRFANAYLEPLDVKLEWIVPIDADEFITLPEDGPDLAQLFKDVWGDQKIVAMRHSNVMGREIISKLDESVDIYRGYPLASKIQPLGATKCAFRYSDAAWSIRGNHFVQNCASDLSEIANATANGIVMRHFPWRSVEHLKRKAENTQRLLDAGVKTGGPHWHRLAASYAQGGEQFLVDFLQQRIDALEREEGQRTED